MSRGVRGPKHDELYAPVLKALRSLGGSGRLDEIDDAVACTIEATQTQLDATNPKNGVPILAYNLRWARTYLKITGLVMNPTRGVWVLSEEGRRVVDKPMRS